MTQKRMFNVLAAIPKHDGSGEWWMRVGRGSENRDDSINVYLDAIPATGNGKGIKLQIRELDADDLAKRDAFRANAGTSSSVEPPARSGVPGSAGNAHPF